MMDTNYFARLNQINVSEHIEHKGSFAYLSWPYAVAELRLADPTAFWEIRRFNGLPYLQTEVGYFVEVAVTVAGITLSQIHPVLDGKNRPIFEPTAFDINTSIQRCLVKAIALHGLGLYVYAGGDLPEGESARPAPPKAPVAPINGSRAFRPEPQTGSRCEAGWPGPRSSSFAPSDLRWDSSRRPVALLGSVYLLLSM